MFWVWAWAEMKRIVVILKPADSSPQSHRIHQTPMDPQPSSGFGLSLPIGSIVVPFCGLYFGSYKVISQKGTAMEPLGN